MKDQDFMKLALDEAKTAYDKGEFPVGCIIVYDNQIIAKGSRINSRGIETNEIDHAEMNAIRHLNQVKEPLDKKQITLYCTMEPCLMCYGAILLSGITRIVYAYEDAMGGGTSCNLKILSPLYKDTKIDIVPHVMRSESLALFKSFFADPKNDYWRDSLLSRYTLDQ